MKTIYVYDFAQMHYVKTGNFAILIKSFDNYIVVSYKRHIILQKDTFGACFSEWLLQKAI